MTIRRGSGAAGLGRVLIGAGMIAGGLTLPPAVVFAGADEPIRSSVQVMAAIEVGMVAGPLGALWWRRVGAARWRGWWHEFARGGALAAGVGTGVTLAHLAGLGWLLARGGSLGPDPWSLLPMPALLGAFAAVATAVTYGLGRGVVLAWAIWDRRRRTRLRWALTHALLVASLALAVVVATLLVLADVGRSRIDRGSLPELIPADASLAETVLALTTLQYLPAAFAIFAMSVVVGVVIVPPVALIAFPVLHRATRRLEDLTAAADALRAGRLGARSPVSGEDEVARLQIDFNAMAADLERAIAELRAERDAVGRLLDARRELVAAVSHELRTPVATIRGYLDSALAHWESGPPPMLKDDLAVVSDETERLRNLIDDLFILSRAEIGRLPLTLQPTDVGPLLRRVAATAAPLAWERGRVEVLAQTPDDLPPAITDPARLEQVVRNLVTNAVRHTPPGGVVLLTADGGDDAVVVRVRDTGAGIAAEDLPRIWDRFFRTADAGDGDRGGAGLGLALAKELTEAMGGTVAVESVRGEGSCFTLRLPVAPPDERRADAGAAG